MLDAAHPIEVLASRFELTPTELPVLMMVVQAGGAPPVLGISETTVKTRVKHIFAKTNTIRLTQVVKLVAAYMSPFNG